MTIWVPLIKSRLVIFLFNITSRVAASQTFALPGNGDVLQDNFHQYRRNPGCYRIFDLDGLIALGQFSSHATLASRHQEWVERSLNQQRTDSEPAWTESIAVDPQNLWRICKSVLA